MKARFIGKAISVEYDNPPLLTKKPHCPNRFVWGDETCEIVSLLQEWRDFGRRGRMASNMQPEHAAVARKRGSWGVGRYYFQVRVDDGRTFELYYDRTPQDADRRTGGWFLKQEIINCEL